MKYVLAFVVFLVSTKTQGQEHESFKGHWYYCNPYWEYTEVLITDSVIDIINFNLFNGPSIPYKFESGKGITCRTFSRDGGALFITDDSENCDTLTFQTILQNQIILGWFNRMDTLTRLRETPKNIYDYDCSVGMSRMQFNSILLYEFQSRSVKPNLFCTRSILHEIETQDNTVYSMDDDWEDFWQKDSTSSRVSCPFVSTQYIETDTALLNHPIYVTTKFNPDSTSAVVVVDLIDKCYDNYRGRARIDSVNTLALNLIPRNDTACNDRCAMRLYFELSLQNFVFNRVRLNGNLIKE